MNPNLEPLAIFSTAGFVSDQIRDPEDWFSHDVACMNSDLVFEK